MVGNGGNVVGDISIVEFLSSLWKSKKKQKINKKKTTNAMY